MKLRSLLPLLSTLFAACGGGADVVSGVQLQLVSSQAGGLGGSCPNSAAHFTLLATNTTSETRVLTVTRIDVNTEHGTLVSVDGAEVALEREGAPFDGAVPAGVGLEIDGAARFNTAFASYADSQGTWHSEVLVRVGQESTVLIGEDQTNTWAHTECYTP
jgi:hypothetical protein